MAIAVCFRRFWFGVWILGIAMVAAPGLTASEAGRPPGVNNDPSCSWKLALFGRAYDVDYAKAQYDANGELLPVWNLDDTAWALRRAAKERRPVRLLTMGYWRFGKHYPSREGVGLLRYFSPGAITLETLHGAWQSSLDELDRRHIFIGDPLP